ncbi:hypothetical protein DFH27DRAFT_569848 [Peziza echinospora]|nr:hypothetical protein DFH27DRAFT_569848 [Peziza echinospora]
MDERLARSTKRRENPKEEEKSTATRDERLARSSKRRENSNSAISVPQTKNDWKSLQSQMYTQADAKSQDTQDLHEAVAHLGMPIAGAATSHAEATSRATIDSEQPQYTNRWSLPPLENPKLLAPTRRRRHSQLAPSRSESAQQVVYQRILDSPYEHPKWLVQKAAIALKLKGQTWCPPKRISPGTVMLIKSISRQSPNLFTAAELAAKFKITPEAVRKVLKSKWMPKEGSDDAEDRLRRWLKRGEVIRGAKIEKGQIWTQEERKRRYEKNVAKAELDRLREMFGPKPEKNRGEDGEDESTPVTLGRISLSTKIL